MIGPRQFGARRAITKLSTALDKAAQASRKWGGPYYVRLIERTDPYNDEYIICSEEFRAILDASLQRTLVCRVEWMVEVAP